MTDLPTTDQLNVELLAGKIGAAIITHYENNRGNENRATVFEVLNALAVCAALQIQGAGSDGPLVYNWFLAAIKINLPERNDGIDVGDAGTVSAITNLAAMKAMMLRLLEQIDFDIEQRKHGGNDEQWKDLDDLSTEAHALVKSIP